MGLKLLKKIDGAVSCAASKHVYENRLRRVLQTINDR